MAAVATILAPALTTSQTFAEPTCTTSGNDKSCSDTSSFSVSVKEILTVSLTKPKTWATGDVNTLLTNKVTLSVSSNNTAGYIASMTTGSTNTNLTNQSNSSYYLTSLSGDNVSGASDSMLNHWGYNVVNENAAAPTTFSKMVANNASSPITILSSTTPVKTTKDVYFGAKASASMASGTYGSTIVVSVVSGVNTNPATNPTNPTPATPTTDPTSNDGGTVAYDSSTGAATGSTVYTNNYTSGTGSSATSTTYSEISSGNNTSAYDGYTYPQGETNTTNTVASINEGTPLATGLAVTAGVAAVAGIAFFVVAKRREKEDDDYYE